MNLDKIKDLIENKRIKAAVLEVLEFEQSQLHKSQPRYKEVYGEIIERQLDADNENQAS